MTMIRALQTAALVGVAVAALSTAAAQEFPSKPLRIISAYPTGISPDIATRVVADQISRGWNQQVIVDPRPGGNGFIAIGAVKRAPADGYELLLVGVAHLAVNPNLFKSVPYDPENDFAPVSPIYRTRFLVVVSTSGPYQTINDLVAAAKSAPDKVSYSSPYVGSPPHFGGALLAHLTGTQMLHVPFKEGPQLYTAVANGDVSFSVASAGSATPLVKAGKLKYLLAAAPSRIATLPDVPTAAEVGLPGYEVDAWIGLVAPRGTPAEIVQRLNREVVRALAQPETQERFRGLGVEPAPASPAQMAEMIRADLQRYRALVKQTGIKAE